MRIVTLEESVARPAPTIYAEPQYGRAVAATEGSQWLVARTPAGEFQVPLLVRTAPDGVHRDALTPYGYGGMHLDDSIPVGERGEYWSGLVEGLRQAGVVSVFVRFPPFTTVGGADRLGAHPGMDVAHISDTVQVLLQDRGAMWTAMRGRSRTAIRAAEKAGLSASVVEVDEAQIEVFRQLYDATMERVSAAAIHRHGSQYYRYLLEDPSRVRVVRVDDGAGSAVAACLVLLDEAVAHYHLSGSNGSAAGASNLMLWGLLQWAHEHGMDSVHLGGGLQQNDSLFSFKMSLGGTAVPFHVGRLIVDPIAYDAMTSERAADLGLTADDLHSSGFFPAYRSGGI